MTRRLGLLALGAASLAAGCARAPLADDDATTLARFADARALAVTPGGGVYVVDAGEAVVVVLGPGRVAPRTLGGPGTGDGGFLSPVDIDPTNGQALFVADEAGTVVHLTAEGRVAESVAVPDVDPTRIARAVGPTPTDAPRGRPLALAAAADGALYVVEGQRGVVLRLDSQRETERVLGARGAGALAEPVGVAVGPGGTVYVADAGRGVLQPFDAFGAPLLALPVDGQPVAVGAAGDSVWVVTPSAVTLFGAEGDRQRTVPVALGEPLVDAAFVPGGLLVLTRTRLVRID